MTHICVSNLTTIGSVNGLSPGRRQVIIWTNAGILLIRTLGTNFSEILGEIHPFSFSKMHLNMSSAKWRLFGLGLNELSNIAIQLYICSILLFLNHCFTAGAVLVSRSSGPRFNINMSSYQYRKSHCGDKTVVRSSYLHNGISYTLSDRLFYCLLRCVSY